MRAISAFSRDAGISTRVCLAVTALRIRVSISAIGSVISLNSKLIHQLTRSPTALGDSRDVTLERQLPEAQAAQRELSHVGARTAAQAAAVAQPDLELRLFQFLRDFCSSGHSQFCRNGIPMNCSSFRAS